MNLLFHSTNFASYQCDSKRCFFLALDQKKIQFSLCQLLAFRKKLNTIDLEAHFSDENKNGIEIISLCNRSHLLILNTLEIIELRELIKATFGMLELNTLVEYP